MRSSLTFVLVTCLTVGAAAQSETDADPPPRDSPQPAPDAVDPLDAADLTAAQAYQLGVKAFEAERYEEAERAWRRAYELDPKPTFLIAIASALEKQGDADGAVQVLEEYLRKRPDAPDQESVKTRIATYEETPATLVVRSSEDGQAILLNGKPSGKKTPAALELPPGTHTVAVVQDGQRLDERQVQVGFGERKELAFKAVATEEVIPQVVLTPEDATPPKPVPTSVWVTSGIAAGALVAGTALGFSALAQEQKYRDNPTAETADKGDKLAIFADLSFGIAAGAAITALVLYFTSKKKKDKDAAQAKVKPKWRVQGRGMQAGVEF